MGERRGNEEAASDSTVAQAFGSKGKDLVAGDARARPAYRFADAVLIGWKQRQNH